MTKLYNCDKCSIEFMGDPEVTIDYGTLRIPDKHLCEDCAELLEKWMREKP